MDLIEVRLGRGLGGNPLWVLTGDVASVRSAVEAGRTAAREKAWCPTAPWSPLLIPTWSKHAVIQIAHKKPRTLTGGT